LAGQLAVTVRPPDWRSTQDGSVSTRHSHSPVCQSVPEADIQERCLSTAIVRRLVWRQIVVESDPFSDAHPALVPIGVASSIDLLLFERSSKAFEEDVVHSSDQSTDICFG
jgi:hypothetical protein